MKGPVFFIPTPEYNAKTLPGEPTIRGRPQQQSPPFLRQPWHSSFALAHMMARSVPLSFFMALATSL